MNNECIIRREVEEQGKFFRKKSSSPCFEPTFFCTETMRIPRGEMKGISLKQKEGG